MIKKLNELRERRYRVGVMQWKIASLKFYGNTESIKVSDVEIPWLKLVVKLAVSPSLIETLTLLFSAYSSRNQLINKSDEREYLPIKDTNNQSIHINRLTDYIDTTT